MSPSNPNYRICPRCKCGYYGAAHWCPRITVGKTATKGNEQ